MQTAREGPRKGATHIEPMTTAVLLVIRQWHISWLTFR